MKIDWFDFWLIFSAVLVFSLLVGVIIKLIHWIRFKKDLSYIKQEKIHDIVKKTYGEFSSYNELTKDLSNFKDEIDFLKKDVSFDLYDKSLSGDSIQGFDLEESLEKILDGKILDLIKEKDLLIQQKDSIIGALEDKNQKILRDVVNKMFFILMEKNKLIREKDTIIVSLKEKVQEMAIIDLDKQFSSFDNDKIIPVDNSQPIKRNIPSDFINVNFIEGK